VRELTELHRHARAIFAHALSSVDPRKAVRQAITAASLDPPIYAIAIGKAARSMALGLAEALGDKLVGGVISAPELLDTQGWQSFVGGHPSPNEASLEAAQAAFKLLDRANSEQAVVIFLISGGGSAICEWPISDDISLADLRRANQVLVNCGARIAEVNSVRRAFSAVKGGALARRASRAQILTLIVSDTNRGDEASVASGPSLPAPADAPSAIDVVERYRLEPLLPEPILKAVQRARPSNSTPAGSHVVLLDNWTAIEAARHKALELGYACASAAEIGELPIAKGCELVLSPLLSDETDQSFCLISGSEFSCPVRGDGRGGRNLETVLRCAILLDKNARQDSRHSVILSAGTDGIDGNSPAAGAIADETTVERARNRGLDPDDFLARSDSYTFFEQLGDLVVTGQTGTNVRDLQILLGAPDHKPCS
jgi:glycerate 2-kinase